MKRVRLGDVINVARGGSPRPIQDFISEDLDAVNWIMIGDTTSSKYITSTKYKIKREGISKSRKVYKGDFLLTNSMSFGRPYILQIDGCIHDGWLVLSSIKQGTICNDYFYYYLSSSNLKSDLAKMAAGAVVKNLNSEIVRNLKIPLPPLAEQKAIAAKLDKADEIKRLNQQLVEKYDALTQSLFIDMFGDPVKNEKGWDKAKIKDVCTKIGSGATPKGGKESYKVEGISLVRSMNVYDREFYYKDLAYISDEQADRLKNVTVYENDVLFNITGASVCRCTVVPTEILPARVNQHVAILRCNEAKLNFTFLNFCLISDTVKRLLLKIGSGGGAVMEAITKEQLEKFEIILPTIDRQNQFAERVHAIELQKKLAQDALTKSEALFNSLLQQSFQE